MFLRRVSSCREDFRDEITIKFGRFPEPAGKIFMASLIYNGIKKNLPRWDVKIVCALHLLRKYQAVYDLVNMTREEVRKKFEQLEWRRRRKCRE